MKRSKQPQRLRNEQQSGLWSSCSLFLIYVLYFVCVCVCVCLYGLGGCGCSLYLDFFLVASALVLVARFQMSVFISAEAENKLINGCCVCGTKKKKEKRLCNATLKAIKQKTATIPKYQDRNILLLRLSPDGCVEVWVCPPSQCPLESPLFSVWLSNAEPMFSQRLLWVSVCVYIQFVHNMKLN